MVHAGGAILREVHRVTGFQTESALILTTVKNIVYTMGAQADEQNTRALPNATMVVACYAKGQVLVHAVVQRTAEESRKLYPNNFADEPKSCALPLIEIWKSLGQMLRFDNLLVGWNVDADLMALHMAVPAIQVVDLAREPAVRASVEAKMKSAGTRLDPNAIRSQLLNVVGPITGERLKLPMGKTDSRDPLVDDWAIAALWRHFVPDIVRERACTLSWMVIAGHSWVGMANMLECVVSTPSRQFLNAGANLVSGGLKLLGRESKFSIGRL